MDEAHYLEVEKSLLYVSEARNRCKTAAAQLRREGAEPHLVTALEKADRELQDVHRRLMQGTLFAVSDEQLSMKP